MSNIARCSPIQELAARKADSAAIVPARKIASGVKIASHTPIRLAAMHDLITAVTPVKPQLEMELRHMEASVSVGAQQIILDYMLR